METAIIVIQCPDQKGIVAKISDFIFRQDANIIQSDQYSTDPLNGRFFMRIEFFFDPLKTVPKNLEKEFGAFMNEFHAEWNIYYASKRLRVGILVSKQDHCLCDLLYRWRSGELFVDIPFVISNHADVGPEVARYGIPFHCIPVTASTKQAQETVLLELVKDSTDFLVLARYMQVLSNEFVNAYDKDIINIHHSFLPSFKGADPYRQAYDRGVKIIGATAHYVTADLDEGPIIDQIVEKVSHRDTVDALKRKGRNLEKIALANAVRTHVEHRVIRDKNKTIVFE